MRESKGSAVFSVKEGSAFRGGELVGEGAVALDAGAYKDVKGWAVCKAAGW